MLLSYLRKGKTALNVAGFERSKFWSRKMSGMSSFCAGCCKEGRGGDEFDAGRGEGVVSLDEAGEEAEEGETAEVECKEALL